MSSLKARLNGFRQYDGVSDEICSKIVKDCWNGEYFQTSTRNFIQFWTRDFGICTEALVKLGYRDKVVKTLDYALSRFSKSGRVETAITPGGKPYSFPNYASDSLPFLIRSLKLAKSKELIEKYRGFLEKETQYYFSTVFDDKTGMVRKESHFSSMKDYSLRKSATYDNCMAAMLKNDLAELKLFNPFSGFDIRKNIKENLWNGSYFYDDLAKQKIVAGDANTFPFWTGVFDSRKMFSSCLKAMQRDRLDKPLPLKYTSRRDNNQDWVIYELFVKDYETDSVWCHLGLCFLDVVKKYDKKQFNYYVGQYNRIIEKNRNFLEVFDSSGKPFRSLFYLADEGMLWASKLLVL